MANQTREFKMPDRSKRPRPAVSSMIGAILCGIVAIALAVYAAFGGAGDMPIVFAIIAVVLILLLGVAMLMRERRGEKMLRFCKRIRPIAVILAAPLGFYLLERASNNLLFTMHPYYVLLNVCLLGIIYIIIYTIGQRSRASIVVYLAICLIIGLVNHFVILFKSQPITPSDLAAWQTAFSVSGGYSYTYTEPLLECIVIFIFYCVVLAYLPKFKITKRSVIVCTAIAVAFALGFGIFFTHCNIAETFNVSIYAWTTGKSYGEQGTPICFCKQLQDLQPNEPDGYSSEEADKILKEADESQVGDTNRLDSSAEDPTVIAVMNETFADLSMYPGLEGTDAYPDLYYEIADSAVESGDVYVSVCGAGTCNSEFEFLTGSSIGNLGGDIYPYMFYDLTGTTCLSTYFNSLGYATHAIHPAEATNWRRDRVYLQFEFNDFADITYFDHPDTLRDLVTDRATYDYVLDLLDEDEDPQFIFDVTIQNHSGYDVGGISKDKQVTVDVDGSEENDRMNEYLSCIQQSDEDIAYFVEQLDELDRPIVLCFFGDHQPNFADWLFQATHNGIEADRLSLNASQERYRIPYMIWANKAAQEEGITKESVEEMRDADAKDAGLSAQDDINEDGTTFTSLNYLSARMIEDCGLPLSAYQKFLLDTDEVIPAMNLNGYMTSDGEWHEYDDESDLPEVINDYAIIQYDNLFNKDANW